MRILNATVEEWRCLHGQSVPLDGFVVLFGANSAGKSQVLAMVDVAFSERAELWKRDSFVPEDEPEVFVFVELDGCPSDAEEPDYETYQRMFDLDRDSTRARNGDPDAVPDPHTFLYAMALGRLEEEEVGDAADHEVLAEVIARSSKFVVLDSGGVGPVPELRHVRADEVAAIRRLASAGLHAAQDILDGREKAWGLYGDGFTARDLAAATLLGLDMGGIDEELHAVLEELRTQVFGPYEFDPWLEPVSRSERGGSSAVDINPQMTALAALIENRANERSPGHVSSAGRIRVSVIKPAYWSRMSERVKVLFEEPGGTFALSEVGSGVARWAAAAVRLAVRDLRVRSVHWTSADGKAQGAPWITESIETPFGRFVDGAPAEGAEDALRQASETGRIDEFLEVGPTVGRIPEIFIVDEPEANLHPGAIKSVRDWLLMTARAAQAVVVATHHPAFFDLPSGTPAHFVLVRKSGDRAELVDVTDNLDAMQGALQEVGVSRAELLQLTRLALFVEGPHDVAVLDAFFGEELREYGIRLFPMHGVKRIQGLIESEVVHLLGIPVGVLTDNTDITRVLEGAARPGEETEIASFLRRAAEAGRRIEPFGLSREDIICYLDARTIRDFAPAFPGWDVAGKEAWLEIGKPKKNWKVWLQESFPGFRTDVTGVEEIARACAAAGHVDPELRRVIKAIEAYAALSPDERERGEQPELYR